MTPLRLNLWVQSGYRQLHDLRARTTSPNPTWRLLFVGLGLLLYNRYILLRRGYRTTRRSHCQLEESITLRDLLTVQGSKRYLGSLGEMSVTLVVYR